MVALNPGAAAALLAEKVVARVPELAWVLDYSKQPGSRRGLVEEIIERFSRQLSKDLEVAGLVAALCDALGHRAPATGPGETIKVTIKEEALGRYFPRTRTVELYPRVIEPVAETLGIPADQLTTVVLAHELAHGVTHLGVDADQVRWPRSTC